VIPVGGSEAVKTDFRVISATHQDLVRSVEAGTFRHDLYFRLASFQLHLPPLRERRDDIDTLAEHFLSQMAGDDGRRARLSPETLAELKRRPWRGNVRELRNVLEHAATLAGSGVVAPEHLPPPVPLAMLAGEGHAGDPAQIETLIARWTEARLSAGDAEGTLHEQLLAIVEPPLIREALRRHHQQVAAAARELGLHRTTLKKKMDQYGIETE
jgi:two-component system nitrogen regulation response regulator GlnG